MSQGEVPLPRVLVGAISHGRSRTHEELGAAVSAEVRAAKLPLVRSVNVNLELEVVRQLITNVSNDNEADAIILLGGAGFGVQDHTCEAVDGIVERRIEGFGGAYRRLLETEFELGAHAWLVRATAGVFNQCLVFALTGHASHVTAAVQKLIVPTLPEAFAIATGKLRAVHLRA
jgi:molybdenum cofactor biosynthesis protein B